MAGYDENGNPIDPCDVCGEPRNGEEYENSEGQDVCESCYNDDLDEDEEF